MAEASMSSSNLLSWMKVANEKQLFYYECLGKKKWELYEPNDLYYLNIKIGFALFGPPKTFKEKDIEKTYILSDQKKRIDCIMKAIKGIATGTILYIGFIYVILLIDHKYSEIPIFRVLKERDTGKDVYFFIDSLGKTYEGFEKFLQTNSIPSCIACYPRNGFYTCVEDGLLQLDYWFPKSSSLFSGLNEPENSRVSLEGSYVKGVTEETEVYCYTISSSSDQFSSINAIYFSYLLLLYSLEYIRITPFVANTLKIGSIRTNWSAVINLMRNILKDTYSIDYQHIAQVRLSILFFCHAVVYESVVEELLNETLKILSKPLIHYEMIPRKFKIDINCNYEEVRLISRISSKNKLCKEMVGIEATRSTNENYRIENLLEVLKAIVKTNNRLDILTNYYLLLQELNNNCKECCQEACRFKKEILFDDDEKSKLSELDNSHMKRNEIMQNRDTAKHSAAPSLDINSSRRLVNFAVGTSQFASKVFSSVWEPTGYFLCNGIPAQIVAGTGELLLGMLQAVPGQLMDHGLGKIIEIILK